MYVNHQDINDEDIEKWEILVLLLVANDAPTEMIDEKLQRIKEMRQRQNRRVDTARKEIAVR